MRPHMPRTMLLGGLLLASAMLCSHGAHCDADGDASADRIVPVIVESGLFSRASGEIVAGTIPSTVFPDVNGQWRVDPASIRVLSPDGAAEVPFRLSLRDDGSPDRLALQLAEPLPPLSAARYSLRFRPGGPDTGLPAEISSPDAEFPWPSTDTQLMRRRNGGFETGDDEAEGWSLIRGEVCEDNPHGGRRCVKLHKTEDHKQHPMASSAPFPITPSARYVFKLRARGVKIGKAGYIIAASLYFLDGDKKTVKSEPWRANVGSRDLPNEWTMISASASAPPETRYGQVRVLMYGAQGTLWVDDIEVACPVSAQLIPATVRFEPATQSPPEPGE